jgi:hypothetical protein
MVREAAEKRREGDADYKDMWARLTTFFPAGDLHVHRKRMR